ncbi:MAG: sulfatase [Planctomycetes bacterium]|nr:sulfatase [Planctomycetota bacterium]
MRIASSLLVALFLIAFALGCSKSKPPNVVIVVLDTARPDKLSVYGDPRPTSPFLDEFALQATAYERAYASSGWTLPAHATLFTGTLPSVHHATQTNPKLAPDVATLAEELSKAGYATGGFSNNPWVAEHTGLARGFQRFVDKWEKRDRANDDPGAHPTVQSVRAWLDETKQEAQPFFLFVNLIEPHMPYLPPLSAAAPFFPNAEAAASAANRFFEKGKPFGVTARHYQGDAPLSKEEWAELEALYAGELRYTDTIVRAIVSAVDTRVKGEDTLVFLVSDHGESFGDHGHISHNFHLYDSNVRVALLARGPGIASGARETKLAQLADVFATAMAAAGRAPSAHCVGADLRKPLSGARVLYAALDQPVISLGALPEPVRASGKLTRYERELEAVIGPRWKLIRGSDGSEELYDLLADPQEERPLPASDDTSAFVGSARGVIEAVRASGSTSGRSGVTDDPRVRESLKSLGYSQ